MKQQKLIVLMLIIVLALAGCSSVNGQPQANINGEKPAAAENMTTAPAQDKVIKTGDKFQKTYSGWVSRMEDIAAKTNSSYNDWLAGKVSRDKLNSTIGDISKQMESLNLETDLKSSFSLSPQDKKLVNYDAVTNNYAMASKFLNNFLVDFPHFNDQRLKQEYVKYTGSYNKYLPDLKKDLNVK